MSPCSVMTFGTQNHSFGEKFVKIDPIVDLKIDVKLRVAFLFAFSV